MIMKTIEECVVSSMDGTDKMLFPFLPYIFQDLWEIGADPEVIIKLIEKNFERHDNLTVLDLGCGKGAVSIKVARKFGCKCHGIDAIPEFISCAREKAIENNVRHLCKFETGDIREMVRTLAACDIIILGAIGPVFGDYYATLTSLSGCLRESGIIIIDDGYIENHSNYAHPMIQKKETILRQIKLSGMQIVQNEIFKKSDIKKSDKYIFQKLEKRCLELIDRHPDKKGLFINYIKKQDEENYVLENKVVCVTMLIKKINTQDI